MLTPSSDVASSILCERQPIVSQRLCAGKNSPKSSRFCRARWTLQVLDHYGSLETPAGKGSLGIGGKLDGHPSDHEFKPWLRGCFQVVHPCVVARRAYLSSPEGQEARLPLRWLLEATQPSKWGSVV